MNLCVMILTSKFGEAKGYPKSCYQIGNKTILEIIIETVWNLNPDLIILMVEKNHIVEINRLLKYNAYSKIIRYYVFDRQKQNKMSMAKSAYKNKNLLVLPGNIPLIKFNSLLKILYQDSSTKISNDFFYLIKEDLDQIDEVENYANDYDIINAKELISVENKNDLEKITNKFYKK